MNSTVVAHGLWYHEHGIGIVKAFKAGRIIPRSLERWSDYTNHMYLTVMLYANERPWFYSVHISS